MLLLSPIATLYDPQPRMSLPPRDDIDPKYRFDLTRLFETPDEWTTTRDELIDRLDTLDTLTTEPPETPDELQHLLDETEACYRVRQRLDLYTTLSANVNTGSEATTERERAFRELDATFLPVASSVRRTLGSIDDDRFATLVEPLDDYRYYAENLRAQAIHVRSPAVEEIIAAHEESRSSPTRILRTITTEDFDPPHVERPNGETVAIRPGNYQTELSHSDRDYRQRVYDAYHAERRRFAATIVQAATEKLAAAATEADVRGYDSIRDHALRDTYPESGVEPSVSTSIHDTLLDAIRDTLGPYHRAQRLRRDRLGVDRLRPWDWRVSLAKPPAPTIDYEEAKELVIDSLAPLGEAYVDRARQFLGERRVDVFPTQDKRTDIPASCPSAAADGAFILANFRRDIRTTFFVTHELGHALNVAYHREGPLRYATSPGAVCEIPSLLHELLLAEHCIQKGGTYAAHARNRLVECIAGNLYRNARTAAYHHALTTMVEAGTELTPERARTTYADLLDEFDPVYDREGIDDRIGEIGMRIPYSSYQYVLGATGALAVRDRLRKEVLSPGDYREFLRQTGRRTPLDSFAALGLDIRSVAPFECAATTFDSYLDEL